ncbi:MAG: hypothetical protein KQI62_06930 [Deltaproteobacteria bacterium]|nr:hypothetical protein [Deltaproteobacteria bacterium]
MEFGDRLFWGIMIFLAFISLWLGALEAYTPLWLGIVLGAVAGVLFVKFGPTPRTDEDEAK